MNSLLDETGPGGVEFIEFIALTWAVGRYLKINMVAEMHGTILKNIFCVLSLFSNRIDEIVVSIGETGEMMVTKPRRKRRRQSLICQSI